MTSYSLFSFHVRLVIRKRHSLQLMHTAQRRGTSVPKASAEIKSPGTNLACAETTCTEAAAGRRPVGGGVTVSWRVQTELHIA